MDVLNAQAAFDSLSQETRLRAFRLLVRYGTNGTPAGVLSDALGIPQNTLSFHLAHMQRAGLVTGKRAGRSVIYAANCAFFTQLIAFMVEDCCTAGIARVRKDRKNNCSVIEIDNCC